MEVPMRSAILPLLLALSGPTERPEGNPPPEALTVIRAGTLIDGRADAPRRGQVIVVRGRRIEAVGDAPANPLPPGASVGHPRAATAHRCAPHAPPPR